jgi:hypothetical protein
MFISRKLLKNISVEFGVDGTLLLSILLFSLYLFIIYVCTRVLAISMTTISCYFQFKAWPLMCKHSHSHSHSKLLKNISESACQQSSQQLFSYSIKKIIEGYDFDCSLKMVKIVKIHEKPKFQIGSFLIVLNFDFIRQTRSKFFVWLRWCIQNLNSSLTFRDIQVTILESCMHCMQTFFYFFCLCLHFKCHNFHGAESRIFYVGYFDLGWKAAKNYF